jgi:hypothetical protein
MQWRNANRMKSVKKKACIDAFCPIFFPRVNLLTLASQWSVRSIFGQKLEVAKKVVVQKW